ncbi:MAG: oligosaccharide flippase family protein [Rhodothermia bacterium]
MSVSGRIGIARNITWLTGTSLVVKPFWLVFVVFLCWRYLGTAEFGVFSTALWLAFIPAALTDLGLTQLTIRDVARIRESASEYFSNIFVFKLALSPIAWLVAVGTGIALGYDQSMLWSVAWAGVYALALQAMTYLRSFYRAFENLKLEGISTILEKIVVVALGTIGLFWTRSAHGTLAGMATGMIIAVVLNAVWIAMNLARLDFGLVRLKFVRNAVRLGFPIFVYSFAIVVYTRLGGVLLEYWHGERATGEFAAAYRILESLFLLNAVFTAAVMPRLSALYHERRLDRFRFVFSRSLMAAVGLAVVIAGFTSLVSSELMGFINPDEPTLKAATILATLVWVLPLMTAKDLLVVSLLASDRQNYLAWSLAAALAVSLGLHLVLTYPQGASGLIAVFFIVEALIILLCAVQLVRTRVGDSPPEIPEPGEG